MHPSIIRLIALHYLLALKLSNCQNMPTCVLSFHSMKHEKDVLKSDYLVNWLPILFTYLLHLPLCWSYTSLLKLLGLLKMFNCYYLFIYFCQIISVNVSTTNHQPVALDDVELPFKVQFTYSVIWSSTE